MAEGVFARMRSRVAGVLAAMLMLVGIGVAAAPAASAARSDCGSGYACSWNDSFTGGRASFYYNIANYAAWSGYNDEASSVYSHGLNTSCYAEFYDGPNYTFDMSGAHPLRLDPGEYYGSLSNVVIYDFMTPAARIILFWDDKISSARFMRASGGTCY